jgi:hypothetical protein
MTTLLDTNNTNKTLIKQWYIHIYILDLISLQSKGHLKIWKTYENISQNVVKVDSLTAADQVTPEVILLFFRKSGKRSFVWEL